MDGGVRRKQVGPGDHQISLGEDWDLLDLPWANAADILAYFLRTDGDTYGWSGLLVSQVLNRNRATLHAQFCSEWCARALSLPSPSSYSPGTLGELCAYLLGVSHAPGSALLAT
ncbi:hypothetical protein D3C86_1499450 [compost metagenome]